MKRFIIFLVTIISSFTIAAQSSDIKTETFKVEGNCNMCKERIENAAYIKGVKRADWNKDKHELTVVYRSSKTSAEEILQKVAKAGHSSEKTPATEEDYNKLPKCCQYKTNACNH